MAHEPSGISEGLQRVQSSGFLIRAIPHKHTVAVGYHARQRWPADVASGLTRASQSQEDLWPPVSAYPAAASPTGTTRARAALTANTQIKT
jgi:hypothetical protein